MPAVCQLQASRTSLDIALSKSNMKLSDNPLLRVLAVIVLTAAGIRITFELLEPGLPYLFAALFAAAVMRAIAWWRRDRW